ncbi:hypothetical protein V5O48_016597 [Marasmius crinis-equi]|uniref:Glycosyltransferase n=1 Tax=Marasmius crinis-equi TaxID=585013 RepID=A0ABR3ER90_9AGAR
MSSAIFVYYCSGHGYGHATRVSALTSHLLRLPAQHRPQVHIVSEAPKHVFADSIALGAQYRYADWIDPVVVQPVAYRVDRQKSVDVLKAFMKKKDVFVETERAWLAEIRARCVLSDAAFLGCLAAKAAGIPSILVTNFTFDSVYSYLSTTFIDVEQPSHQEQQLAELLLPTDIPIPHSVVEPLVRQIHDGYRHADLLLLLPGQIPIPSFSTFPPLPSPAWVDLQTHAFDDDIINSIDPSVLVRATETESDDRELDVVNDSNNGRSSTIPPLYPHIPFPPNTALHAKSSAGCFKRRVLRAPLLVRSPAAPSRDPAQEKDSVYTPEGRARLLSSIGVPENRHDPEKTKILVVSFGGQVFRRPVSGRSTPRRRSGSSSPKIKPSVSSKKAIGLGLTGVAETPELDNDFTRSHSRSSTAQSSPRPSPPMSRSSSSGSIVHAERSFTPLDHRDINPDPRPRPLRLISTGPAESGAGSPGQAMWIPGAPSPALVPSSILFSPSVPPPVDEESDDSEGEISFQVVPATPACPEEDDSETTEENFWDAEEGEDALTPSLLPDESWIAVVCGVSKEQWEKDQEGEDGGLPENFYVAPKDVYMPDLTAAADVLLGKIGYGTVAECVDSKTPVVFVPRPLFIEEHGLKLLLQQAQVPGVELTREEYEKGEWASKVNEAWIRGKTGKRARRLEELEPASVDPATQGTGSAIPTLKPRIPGMVGIERRHREGREMAMRVVQWVDECWSGVESC